MDHAASFSSAPADNGEGDQKDDQEQDDRPQDAESNEEGAARRAGGAFLSGSVSLQIHRRSLFIGIGQDQLALAKGYALVRINNMGHHVVRGLLVDAQRFLQGGEDE